MPGRPWSVFRPQPLIQRAATVWTVDDAIPGIPGADRRMSIFRYADGSLLFYNAIPVPEETLNAIRALGRPAYLVVPNRYHALDAAPFAERLGLAAFASPATLNALSSRFSCRPVNTLPPDPGLQWFTVEGFKTREVVLLVHGTLLVGDLVTNVPHVATLRGLLMRLIGFTGPAPKLPGPVRKRVGEDMTKVRALLDQLAQLDGVSRLIPSHGPVVETNVREALQNVARTL
jgi:hypothetical protein